MTEEFRQVMIPEKMYTDIEAVLQNYQFKNVDEFIIYLINDFLYDTIVDESSNDDEYSAEDEEMIKSKLRGLGYFT